MADISKIAIYSQDSNGNSFSNSYRDINPEITVNDMRAFVTAVGALVNGDLVKFVRTDSTTYYPVAEPAGE